MVKETSKERASLNGLILCGGKSSRMGKDKCLISYHDEPQYQFLTNLISPYVNHVFISGNKPLHTECEIIGDKFDFNSPLNGILSAFDHKPKYSWLIVACDMPLISEKHIELLLKHRDTSKMATCFSGSDKKPDPLFAIYEHNCFEALKYFSEKNISPRQFLIQNDVKVISTTDKGFLTNINSTFDYNRLIADLKK